MPFLRSPRSRENQRSDGSRQTTDRQRPEGHRPSCTSCLSSVVCRLATDRPSGGLRQAYPCLREPDSDHDHPGRWRRSSKRNKARGAIATPSKPDLSSNMTTGASDVAIPGFRQNHARVDQTCLFTMSKEHVPNGLPPERRGSPRALPGRPQPA